MKKKMSSKQESKPEGRVEKSKPRNKSFKSRGNGTSSRGIDEDRISTMARKNDGMREHKYNDPMWYAKNEQMLRDAASYSFNNPIGSPLPERILSPVANSGLTITSAPDYVPSLMAIRILPTIGKSVNASSPANLAANNIYAYVRYQNSGAKNYDQADLMLYLLAMDSIYACWNWMKRVYGYINMYSQYNLTMPTVFAKADRLEFQSIQHSLADFRLFLNRTAAQISSFCVPATMPFFIRHSWMFSNIYKDSDNNKAQMYMFTPAAFYAYSETGSQYGGMLVPQQLVTNDNEDSVMSLGTMMQYLESLINAVAYSEDIGVMSGDILKAYGQDKLFKLTPVEPDYIVTPTYNEEVLNQIHNSAPVPIDLTDTNIIHYRVTQNPDTGYLIWDPKVERSLRMLNNHNHIINMPWDDVTPSNTMVATRLTGVFNVYKEGDKVKVEILTCGTEIVTKYTMYVSYGTSTGTAIGYKRYASSSKILFYDTNPTTCADTARFSMLLSNFDWHPLFYGVKYASENFEYLGVLGDLTNYTEMDKDDLAKLNLTAIMSEFNIPQLSSF